MYKKYIVYGRLRRIFGYFEKSLRYFYMAILLLLLFVGVKLDVDFIYWIIWGVAFTIESINLLSGIHIEHDEEANNA